MNTNTIENFHITISYLENLNDIQIENEINEINSDGLNIRIKTRPSLVVYNSIDWIIPTAIVAYIGKSYFDGYLKEMGKEHYLSLKIWLKKFANKYRNLNIVTITSTQSNNIKDDNAQSKAISLLIQTKNDKIIKLLFDENFTKEDWENAIDNIFDFVIEHYENSPNDFLSKEIEKLNLEFNSKIYTIIDKEKNKLIFYSEKDLVTLHQLKCKK